MYYLYNQAGKDHGPFSLHDLRARVTSGEYPPGKLARTAGSKEWRSIAHFLPDLAGFAASVTVPAAAAGGCAAGRGMIAAPGLRVCAWLYLAASLVTGLYFMLVESSSALIGIGMILQGAAAFFLFLTVAAICDNVRAILSK